MSLKEKLDGELKNAMRSGDTARRDTVRLALSALKNARIAAMHDLDEGEELAVIAKEVKQRRESIAEFEKAGREDLVAKERTEMEILSSFLPEQVGREEIRARAQAIIAETGASGPRDMGKVMPRLNAELRGRADGREVAAVVQELLAGS